MDFLSFKKLYKQDEDYSQRTFDIIMYRKVLDGTLYDALKHPFYKNYNQIGANTQEPIPLCERRPCVRYALSKIVVDDSVSLLFGEGRFPTVLMDDEDTHKVINDLLHEKHINSIMISCATRGSVGSAALFLRLIEGRIFISVLDTEYLTPVYNPLNPEEILQITEKYKISGAELIARGYGNVKPEAIYWFRRDWTRTAEIYYQPWECYKKDASIIIDKERSIEHNFGMVPIVWIKNLPGNYNCEDGLCTFKDAIDTNIELDYQMSQAGRGLKYSSEPLLLIKNPSFSMSGEIVLGGGNVIEVDEKGDAKHVEIDGSAAKAVIDYCNKLREIALENIHGNRSSPEKMHMAQSGRAMELSNLSLIWLADKLRATYGEVGLVSLIKMILLISKDNDIIVNEQIIRKGTINSAAKVSLSWPDWFEPTNDDLMKQAQTLTTYVNNNLMSSRTAIASIASSYDIADIDKELHDIHEQQETEEEEKEEHENENKEDNDENEQKVNNIDKKTNDDKLISNINYKNKG